MLKTAIPKATFSAADAAHQAPYAKVSFATQQSSSTVADVTSRKLSNIVLCSVGEAEGWGISIDEKFIADMVKDIKANMKKGVKSNFRHNYENAGYQLGRINNVRIDGGSVYGDLTCYASADLSPLAPGMATWLIGLVAEDPEAMMMSIVANIAYFFQKDENGNEIKVWEYNADDRWVSPNYEMPIYCAYAGIESCDAVAEGALTEAMFSKNTEDTDFLTKMVNVLKAAIGINQKQPDGIADDPLHAIQEFSKNNIDMTKEETQAMLDTTVAGIEAQFSKKVEELQTQFAAKTDALEAENKKLEASLKDTETQLEAAKAEIKTLSASAADDHADGKKDTGKGKVSMGANHEWLKARYNLP